MWNRSARVNCQHTNTIFIVQYSGENNGSAPCGISSGMAQRA